jgi:hypothetical protein
MASEAPRAALSSENTDAAASESPPSPAAAPSQPTTPASRSQPSSQSSTRSLAQRRIDNILDEARQRKVALAGSTSLAAAAVGLIPKPGLSKSRWASPKMMACHMRIMGKAVPMNRLLSCAGRRQKRAVTRPQVICGRGTARAPLVYGDQGTADVSPM